MMSGNSSVLIRELNLPSRVKRILLRNNIQTWGNLEALSHDDLKALSGMAINVLPDVESALEDKDAILREHTIRKSRINTIYNNVHDIKLSTLNLSNYARHDLLKADIKTAGELIQLSKEDVKSLTSSDEIRQEINNAIEAILNRKIKILDRTYSKPANMMKDEASSQSKTEQRDDKENELESEQQSNKEQENENELTAHKEPESSYDHEQGFDMPDVRQKRYADELKDYIVRGKTVYLPEASDLYKSLKGRAEEKGISLNEYIKQLGYIRITKDPKVITSLSEDDMQVYEGFKDTLKDIYASYPLLGSKIFTEEEEGKLHIAAKEYIDEYMRFGEVPTDKQNMQIALSVINYAKDWDYENSPEFWKYLAFQYDYKDDGDSETVLRKVRGLLQSSVANALNKNNRLFIMSNRGQEYKSTIVIHAFASKRSWMALFDFLFDFYKENLHWYLIPGDPLIGEMIHYLQSKFSDSNEENIDLNIGTSKVYRFQEGIRKLIVFRPVYTQGLFERLLNRIDELICGKPLNIETYEEQLCDEWYYNNLNAMVIPKERKVKQNSGKDNLAIDYTRIHAKYLLDDNKRPCLDLPEIRLLTEDSDEIMLTVYCKDVEVYQKTMSWYGNELGRTIKHKSILLSDLISNNSPLEIRLCITCGEKVIYDSGTDLYRKMLAFTQTKKTEIRSNDLTQGEYIIVVSVSSSIDYLNAKSTSIYNHIPNLNIYYVELNKDFVIKLNGSAIAFDRDTEHDIRIFYPDKYPSKSTFIKEGIEYDFVPHNSSCTILVNDPEIINRYKFLLNGKPINLIELCQRDEIENAIFTIPLEGINNLCHIDILDLENERLLDSRNFYMVSCFISSFNRPFYFSDTDYQNAIYHLKIDEFSSDKPFYKVDDEIQIPYNGGFIKTLIPKISITENEGNWLNTATPGVYIDAIPQTSQLLVTIPDGVCLRFFIGNEDIHYDGGGICEIGNALQSLHDYRSLSEVEIRMRASCNGIEQEYILQHVFYEDTFTKNLEFWYKDNKLYWNQGGCFIGRKNPNLTLILTKGSENSLKFALSLDTIFIKLPDNINIGNYKYKVTISIFGLFTGNLEKTLSEGTCRIGDPNILRFKNKRIVLDAITDSFKAMGLIPIRRCYVDHLSYVGEEKTEDEVCSIYTGIMYEFIHGKRHTFSSEEYSDDQRKITYMTVNPVRIEYLNNRLKNQYLSISNQDRDGLYYYSYIYHNENISYITDREPLTKNKDKYSIPYLYHYYLESDQ